MYFTKITHIFYFLLLIVQCKSDCTISIHGLKNILVLDNRNRIQYPNDVQGHIKHKDCEIVTLACPGSHVTRFTSEKVQFTCYQNKYYFNNQTVAINGISCANKLIPTEKNAYATSCTYTSIRIGFQFTSGEFIPHIDICWDNSIKRAIWVKATLDKHLGMCHVEWSRPHFRSGIYFSPNLSNWYKKTNQINNLIRNYHITQSQIDQDNLLEIGHLVAKCDYLYDAQQKLTFQYINTAPQWRSFNGGNWKLLEDNIRRLIAREKSDLVVYTGTFGILQINGKDFYLTDECKVPVPKYFWKIVIKGTSGLAIVGSNDIFNYSPNICNNIMDSVSWLNLPKANNTRSGHVIACDLADFYNIPGLRNQLPHIPQISFMNRLRGTSPSWTSRIRRTTRKSFRSRRISTNYRNRHVLNRSKNPGPGTMKDRCSKPLHTNSTRRSQTKNKHPLRW